MEKKPNKRGQCGKNALPKRSLTKAEQSLVERMVIPWHSSMRTES